MWNDVEEYREPYDMINNEIRKWSELSVNQSAFLCGLLKSEKPHSILEIGTSAGGTTSIMMKCLSILGIESTCINTVDISKTWYRDKSKSSGWVAQKYRQEDDNNITLKVYSGDVSAYYLPLMKKKFDFVLLDAAHSMPCEILDFICVYPFLSRGAVVVVHDISLMHKHKSRSGASTANCILFSSVVGDKFINSDSDGYTGKYPNIGAFRVNDDTQKYILNVFLALIAKWTYIPDDNQLDKVRQIVEQYYSKECLDIYDEAVKLNKNSYENKVSIKRKIYNYLSTFFKK